MSELKVIDLGNIRESIEKDEPVYYEYYAKSEADKVIAEKDAQIASLNGEITRIQDKMCEDVFEGIMPSEHIMCLPLQEAAKYIAELKAQKAQAEDDCAYWKTMSRKCADDNEVMAKQRAEAFKRERHHKYKRCLAMARWCRESLRLMRTYEVTEDFWNLESGQDAEYFCKKGDFYSKWRKRWLALAEEPTWAKFLQLIHKEAK